MSEIQKPVEPVAPVVATDAPVVDEAAAVETTPVETAEATETPVVAEAAAPVKEEVKPVDEGTLGYKGPGLIKGFRFQKKFFWFGSEAVEHKDLASYLRGEKPEVANHTAAWASNTGKGLLFFSKKASEKTTPSHVFNLSEIADITEEGTVDFFFNLAGHKYTFQTSTAAERDSWVLSLKTQAAEAKELVESVKASEEYVKTQSSLSPPVVVASSPKKSAEVKKEESTEAKEDKVEEKKDRKSRSQSRKRTSIFGSFALGSTTKKEEAKPETPIAPTVEEPAVASEETAPLEPTETVVAEPAPVEPVAETRPVANKRNSIFGTLKNSFKKPEAAPATPAKDVEPVGDNAPIIPVVESTEPLAASTETPTAVPAEATDAPVTNGETKTETPAVVKADKRKSSLPWLSSKKEKSTTGDEDAEKKPTSPFAKLRATVKGKKTSEKVAEPVVEPVVEDEVPAVEEVKTEPSPVATSTPQVAATA